MKKSFLVILLLVNCLSVSGQIKTIIYNEINGSAQKLATLQYNDHGSVYFYEPQKVITTIVKTSDGSTVYPSNTVDSIAGRRRFIFFNKKEKKFYNNQINNDIEMLIVDSLTIDWNLVEEYKTILNYRCQKAVTTFRGKNYAAWFTEQLPLSYGPLKFCDLPGVILELQDESGNLHVIATTIDNKTEGLDFFKDIKKYDFSKAVTTSQYEEILRQYFMDFEKDKNFTLPRNKDGKVELNCKSCNL